MTQTIGTKGEQLNLLIKQGSDFGPFNATMTDNLAVPINLTGCTIRGQIRKTPTDAAVTAQLVVTITAPLAGQYSFTLPASVTAAIACGIDETASASKYVWDMELVDVSTKVIPLYYGDVAVFREVTK